MLSRTTAPSSGPFTSNRSGTGVGWGVLVGRGVAVGSGVGVGTSVGVGSGVGVGVGGGVGEGVGAGVAVIIRGVGSTGTRGIPCTHPIRARASPAQTAVTQG